MAGPMAWAAPGQVLPQLGAILWSWQLCTGCEQHSDCGGESCPVGRNGRLGRYLAVYSRITRLYQRQSKSELRPILEGSDDLLDLFVTIRQELGYSRNTVVRQIFRTKHSNNEDPSGGQLDDCNAALAAAIKIAFMVDPHSQTPGFISLESGTLYQGWTSEESFTTWWDNLFESQRIHDTRFKTSKKVTGKIPDVSAPALHKHVNLQVRGTNNIANHLTVNWDQRVIYVFHHTTFLKEQLRFTRDLPEMTPPDGLKM